MRVILLLVIPALLLAVPKARGAERVALICVDDDPAAGGARQARLEERVRSVKGIELRPAVEIASRLAPESVARDNSGKSRIEELLASAADPYSSNDFAVAEARIAEAESLITSMGASPVADRAYVLVWRMALLLANDDESGAEAQARRLLSIAPDVKASVDTFRPSVARLLDRVRASMPPPVTIRVRGVPHGGLTWIDDRPSAEIWRVAPGSHRLHIEAPGFRSIDLTIDAKIDVVVIPGLLLALAEERERAVIALAKGSELDERLRAQVWEILFRAKADSVIAVVRVGSELHVRGFAKGKSSGRGVFPATIDGEKAVADWISGPRSDALPKQFASNRLEWRVQGGVAASSRSWNLRGDGGGRFSAGFSGAGPRISADVERANLVGAASIDLVSYRMQEQRVSLRDGSRLRVGGGSTLSARANGGYCFSFGSAPSISLLAGVSYEQHDSDAIEDEEGDLQLLPSWERSALDLEFRAEVPIAIPSSKRPAVISFSGGTSPWSRWLMSPRNSLGSSPAVSPALAWGVGADVGFGRRWAARIEYSGRHAAVTFDGVSSAPVDPRLENARASQQTHAVQMTFGRNF